MSPSFGGLFNAVFGVGIILLLVMMPLILFKVGFGIGGVFVAVDSPRHVIHRVVTRVREIQSRVSSRFGKETDIEKR